ncbi:MAG: hypothetical protein HRU19_24660 [Pseudobacteriovorax sp.]|nr:hypothetical protein [Pseudobacteriovorax sp.]
MDLSTTLKEGIAAWLESSPRRNLRLLERFTGVSYSTLRRLQAGERTPTPDSIIPLCEVIFDREQTAKVLAEHYPKMLNFFENIILNGIVSQPDDNARSALLTPDNFIIFVYCSITKKGSREKIRELWGRRGIRALEDLIDSEVLVPEDNIFVGKKERVAFSTANTTISHVTALLDEYKSSTPKDGSKISYTISTVSEKALDSLRQAHLDFLNRVGGIVKDDANDGEIVYYLASFSSVIPDGGGES